MSTEPKRPYNNINTLIQDMLNKLFGAIPGVGPILSNFVTPAISNYLAPADSPINDFIWGDNQTTASLAYLDALHNKAWKKQDSKVSDEVTLKIHKAYHKILNPDATDEQITNMAKVSMDSIFSIPSIFSSYIDPYGMSEGTSVARNVAAMLQNRGAGYNIQGATYARQIRDTIFGDSDRKSRGIIADIVDNPSEYGNMSVADVMSIGRELATTRNYNTKYNTFDSTKFKTDIQELSRALEPWKAIFGDDIPKLMNQLEALTGKSVGLQADTLKSSASRILSVLHTTGANIQHIAAYKDTISPVLMDPTMQHRASLGAHNIASDMVLGLSNTSFASFSTEEFQRLGGLYYTGTARSKFADTFALAYAAWVDKQKDADKATIDEFYGQYIKALDKSGGNQYAALTNVVGTPDLSTLETYRYTGNYIKASESAIGARAARETNFNNALGSMRNNLSTTDSDILTKTLGKDFTSDDLSSFMSMSRDDMISKISMNTNTRAEAVAVVSRLVDQFGRSMSLETGTWSTGEQWRAMLAQSRNEAYQRRLADDRANFIDASMKFSSISGIKSVVNEIVDRGSNVSILDIAKKYTGGNDIASYLFRDIFDIQKTSGPTGATDRDILNDKLYENDTTRRQLIEGAITRYTIKHTQADDQVMDRIKKSIISKDDQSTKGLANQVIRLTKEQEDDLRSTEIGRKNLDIINDTNRRIMQGIVHDRYKNISSFLTNNYIDLPDKFRSIYSSLIDKPGKDGKYTPEQIAQRELAMNTMYHLSKVSPTALEKLSHKDILGDGNVLGDSTGIDAKIKEWTSSGLSSDDITKKTKDYILDTVINKNVEKYTKEGSTYHADQVSRLKRVIDTTELSTYEDVVKEYKTRYIKAWSDKHKNDTYTSEDGKTTLSGKDRDKAHEAAQNKAWGAEMKILEQIMGKSINIDNTDPLSDISKLCGEMFTLLQRIYDKIKQ